MKLFIVFDQLHLIENNTRKCMIELRPKISGFYKGLIYCSSLEQANQTAEYLDRIVKQRIGFGLSPKVKRGCSEFAISFPDYKKINKSGSQLMKYNKNWDVLEEVHDLNETINAKKTIRPTLFGLNLQDILIMQKWVDYAKGIRDPIANSITQSGPCYKEIYDLANLRLDEFHFKN